MTPVRKRHVMGSLVAALLLFAAPVLWLLFQQGMGTATYLNCRVAPPWRGLVGGLATLACAAVAARCWRSRTEGSEARRFLMTVGAGSASIFALAALTMSVALVMVPACAR